MNGKDNIWIDSLPVVIQYCITKLGQYWFRCQVPEPMLTYWWGICKNSGAVIQEKNNLKDIAVDI